MTSVARRVGALQLPIPVGAANTPIADPLANGLLSYLGFWLKWGLDAKLATLGGPDTVVVNDACPVANRFAFDPAGTWIRRMTNTKQPVLYVWSHTSERTKQTMVYDLRVRPIKFMYAFPEFLRPRASPTRAGLIAAVDAIVRAAITRGAHPSYSNGVLFVDTIADPGTLELFVQTTEESFEFEGPQIGAGAGGQPDGGFEQYGFPVLRGTILAHERIMTDSFVDPDDLLGDILTTLTHNEQGDVHNGVNVKVGVLPAPDGD